MDKLHLETNSIGLCLEVKVSRRFKCMYNLGVLTRHFYMFKNCVLLFILHFKTNKMFRNQIVQLTE